MDTATTIFVERIARVLAGQRISANGEGDSESAADAVDSAWPRYREEALAVLHTLRAPTPAMVEVGDAAVWERMVLIAIDEAMPDIVT